MIDFNKYTKSFLANLITGPDDLHDEIKNSRGYVLHLLEKEQLFPDINILFDKLSPLSLNFIVKNYELEKEQIKILKPFFSSLSSNKKMNPDLSEDEVLEYLENNIELPRSLILKPEFINKHHKELIKQIDLNEYAYGDIMGNSVKKMSYEEFFSLDKNFLQRNLFFFEERKEWFSRKEFKDLYKELIYAENRRRKQKVDIYDFKNYHFAPDEGNFLEELLNNVSDFRWNGYDGLLKIKGFSGLMPKMHFFEKYHHKDINIFTEEELGEYNDKIVDILSSRCKRFSDLFYCSATPDKFKLIVNEKTLGTFLSSFKEFDFHISGSDDQDSKDKLSYLTRLGLEHMIANVENDNILKKFSIYDAVRSIEHKFEDRSADEDDKLIAVDFFKKVAPKIIKTKNFEELVKYGSNYFVTRNTFGFVEELVESNPTPNLLFVLLHSYAVMREDGKNGRSTFHNELVKESKKLIDKLALGLDEKNKPTIEKMASYYNYELPKGFCSGNKKYSNVEDNFLNWNSAEQKSRGEFYTELLLEVDPDFSNFIINNKIKLHNNAIFFAINHVEQEKWFNFLKDYNSVHNGELEKNEKLFLSLIKHPEASLLININNDAALNVLWNDFVVASYDKEDSREVYTLRDKMPFDFVQKKFSEVVQLNNFELLSNINKYLSSGDHIQIFYNAVNKMDFNTVMKNLDDANFLSLIDKSISYENNTSISFSKFSDAENYKIAEKLLDSGDKFKKPRALFSVFPEEKYGFIRRFVVEKMPLEVFFSYDLHPALGDKESKSFYSGRVLIDGMFAKEEILEAYRNVEKNEGLFANTDVNARLFSFFQHNFQKNEQEFLDLLEIARKDELKLYAILSDGNIFSDFARNRYGENTTRDEERMKYFKEHFDLEDVKKGLKLVIEEVKSHSNDDYDKKKEFNNSLAISVIDHVVYNTYYDKSGVSDYEYFSDFTKDENESLTKFLFDEVPMYLLSRHTIGDLHPLSKYIKENFSKFAIDGVDGVEHFLFPNPDFTANHFSLSGRYADYLKDIGNGFVDYHINRGNIDEIMYMSYLIQQNKFLSDEVDTSFRFKPEHGSKYSEIVSFFGEDEEIVDKLKICETRFFLERVIDTKFSTTTKKKNKI